MLRSNIDVNRRLTEKEIEMLAAQESKPVTPDEDCPVLTEEQLRQFDRVKRELRPEQSQPTVTLHLSPQTLKKAKSLGSGYTTILSRILEETLNDNDSIKPFL